MRNNANYKTHITFNGEEKTEKYLFGKSGGDDPQEDLNVDDPSPQRNTENEGTTIPEPFLRFEREKLSSQKDPNLTGKTVGSDLGEGTIEGYLGGTTGEPEEGYLRTTGKPEEGDIMEQKDYIKSIDSRLQNVENNLISINDKIGEFNSEIKGEFGEIKGQIDGFGKALKICSYIITVLVGIITIIQVFK